MSMLNGIVEHEKFLITFKTMINIFKSFVFIYNYIVFCCCFTALNFIKNNIHDVSSDNALLVNLIFYYLL